MTLLDTYYRAFKDYRKSTENDKVLKKNRKALSQTEELDKFIVTKYKCKIDEAWVVQIEKGLVFIEKALAEERQFIRSDGEIVPIEKARKVSRDSVVHLASHSNMITHAPENPSDPIVPDSIYMVEKLNDYAVYENRFLYMLLCYLRDFIQLRVDKINELKMSYTCDFSVLRTEVTNSSTKTYETKYTETRTDNQYPLINKENDDILKRIVDCSQIILSLLNTNLMIEVSKAPMVKPPIIKTNVLKMNNNFKNALALYDYIVGYTGEGFVKEEVKLDFLPFSEILGDEIFEVPLLLSFLTYKYGNNLDDMLKKAYDKDEEEKRKEEANKLLEQIARLKKKVEESGVGIEEYLVLLEKRNKMLEHDSQELVISKNKILELNLEISDLNNVIDEHKRNITLLEDTIKGKDKEIQEINQKYLKEFSDLRLAHEEDIKELNQKHLNDLSIQSEDYKKELDEINEKHYEDLEKLTLDHEQKLAYVNEEISKLNETLNEAHQNFDTLNVQYKENVTKVQDELNLKIQGLEEEIKQLNYDKTLISGVLRGLRAEHNLIKANDEFTSKERFEELEDEFDAFNIFFKEQWALTRKSIRKKLLWTKEEKKLKKVDSSYSKKVNDNIDVNSKKDKTQSLDNVETKEDVSSVEYVSTLDNNQNIESSDSIQNEEKNEE